jgi:hypothetical protein
VAGSSEYTDPWETGHRAHVSRGKLKAEDSDAAESETLTGKKGESGHGSKDGQKLICGIDWVMGIFHLRTGVRHVLLIQFFLNGIANSPLCKLYISRVAKIN